MKEVNTFKAKLPRKYKLGGKEIDTVEVREPTVDEVGTAQSRNCSAVDKELFFAADLTGLDPDELRSLPYTIYKPIKKIIDDFLS